LEEKNTIKKWIFPPLGGIKKGCHLSENGPVARVCVNLQKLLTKNKKMWGNVEQSGYFFFILDV
jgi:hypothetical protein